MRYKVEKGIPIPPRTGGIVGSKFDFLDTMEVGDSFVVTGKNEVPRVFQAMKARNMRMSQRLIKRGDNKTTKWRVWYVGPREVKEEQVPLTPSDIFSATG